jgi:hypothetical protein
MTDAELDQLRGVEVLRATIGSDVKLKRVGQEWRGLCPFHSEKEASFSVYLNGSAARFKCFGCGAAGDVFDYVERRDGVDFPRAKEIVAAAWGISTTRPNPKQEEGNGQSAQTWQPMVPPPPDTPKPGAGLLGHRWFEYVGANGRTLFYQRRFDKPDGGKTFGQLTYGTLNGVTGWHAKGPPQPYPLYRLDLLTSADPNSIVIVVEGEGKCEYAERMFPDKIVTSWLNGAGSVDLTNWSPLKRFKEENIIWWADADKPRDKPHGCFLATPAFRKVFPRARFVDTAGLSDIKDGYDAKDLCLSDCDDFDAWFKARLRERGPKADEPLRTKIGRLRVLKVSDLLTLPPRDYFVKGLLSPAEISLLIGPKNARKTFLALHIDYGLAQGWPTILGRRVKQTPTLYLIAEGEAGIGKRVQALVKRYGRCDAFHVVAQPIDLLRSNATTGDLREVIEIVRRFGIGKITVDTVSRAMMGDGENASTDMGTFAGNLSILRHETSAHVMGVHHGTQAEGTKSRGHSILPYSADAIVQIEWDDRQSIPSVTVGFCRDDAIGPLGAFRTEVVPLGFDADGDPITTLIVEECNPGEAPAKHKRGSGDPRFGRLGADARLMFKTIENLIAEGLGEQTTAQPGMARIEAVRRQTVRERNIRDDWHPVSDIASLASSEKQLASSPILTQRGMDREHKALTRLKVKGLIGFTRDWVWLL